MSKRNELTINEDVVVDDWVKIAARGLTPNHLGHLVEIGDVTGTLQKFEHFNNTTVITLWTGDTPKDLKTFDLKYLDEIEVEY